MNKENKRKVLFVISGIAYSGAEKVLEDYIDNTNKVIPYFLFYFDGDAYKHFKQKYNNVFLADIKYNKLLLALTPFMYFNNVYDCLQNYTKMNEISKVFFNNTLAGLLGYHYIKKNQNSILEIHDMKNNFKFIFKKFLIIKTIKCCNNSVTVSSACKKSWNNKIKYVIFNGLKLNDYDFDYGKKEKKIVYIGNSTKRKGSDICLNVAKQMELNSDAKFIMIFGDKIPNYNFPTNVECYCKLERKKIFEILSNSKILFLPARNDPFPTVILEGQLFSNVIVSNFVDGIPEMVPDNRFLSKKNLVDDYIKYINVILNFNSFEYEKVISLQNDHMKNFDIKIKIDKLDKLLLK